MQKKTFPSLFWSFLCGGKAVWSAITSTRHIQTHLQFHLLTTPCGYGSLHRYFSEPPILDFWNDFIRWLLPSPKFSYPSVLCFWLTAAQLLRSVLFLGHEGERDEAPTLGRIGEGPRQQRLQGLDARVGRLGKRLGQRNPWVQGKINRDFMVTQLFFSWVKQR